MNLVGNTLKKSVRYFTDSGYRHQVSELRRLSKLERYKCNTTNLLGPVISFPDAASMVAMYREIFVRRIYEFKSSVSRPLILDCGANIGLSAIFFKQLFPEARVTAFEPDRNIFSFLSDNIRSFNLTNVQLINKGLWNQDTTIEFMEEGADSGRIATNANEGKKLVKIDVMSLRNFLEKPVDFLKIDIEGAELTVLEDCADYLGNVSNIFVEFHSFANADQNLGRVVNILEKAKFRLYIDSFGIRSPKPFLERRVYNGMDMQLNLYGYRNF